MKRDYCVYLVTCTTNGKVYVGLTRYPKRRFKCHVYNAQSGRPGALYRGILAHGPDAFTFEVLRDGLTRKAACAEEMAQIAQRKCQHPDGYNLTAGGDGATGFVCTPEHRAKLSAAAKAAMADPALRARVSASLKGRVKTPEHLAKISKARTGSKNSPETRAKIFAANKGRVWSPEIIAKRAAALKGRKKPEHLRMRLGDMTRGVLKTAEHRKKLGDALRGRKLPPEHIENSAAARRGKPKSEAWKAKVRATMARKKAERESAR